MISALTAWEGTSDRSDDDGRHRLDLATLVRGPGSEWAPGVELDARGQPWALDLADQALRMRRCERTAILYALPGGKFVPRVLGCGVRICPVCARARAARARHRWQAVLELATSEGATLRHLTLTQPARIEFGGLVTPSEARRGWVGTVADRPGLLGRPVGGESLLGAWTRFRATLRGMKTSRKTRDLWTRALGGSLLGIEATGRRKKRPWTPRWHVHAHILCCYPRGWSIPAARSVISAWCRASGADPRWQRWTDVAPEAVREVLKYPFKPGASTQAQRVELLAAVRGLHAHQLGGGWHPRPGGLPDPWRRWREARPEATGARRVYVLELGGWSLYTGQAREGEAHFALSADGDAAWTQDAARMYRALLAAPADPDAALDLGTEDQADEEAIC